MDQNLDVGDEEDAAKDEVTCFGQVRQLTRLQIRRFAVIGDSDAGERGRLQPREQQPPEEFCWGQEGRGGLYCLR